jgi:hypothetical protein
MLLLDGIVYPTRRDSWPLPGCKNRDGVSPIEAGSGLAGLPVSVSYLSVRSVTFGIVRYDQPAKLWRI